MSDERDEKDFDMNRPMLWGMASVLALCAAVGGCAQSSQMIRGQSPTPAPVPVPAAAPGDVVYGPIIGSAPGYAEHAHSSYVDPARHPVLGGVAGAASHIGLGDKDFKTLPHFHDNNFGFEGGYYQGPEGYYTYKKNYAYTYGDAAGGCPHCQNGSACPPGGCPQCGHGCPHHHMTYQYDWPKNLVYPPNVQPAGMVQWPYYTLRGPTDFFMQ